MERCSSSGLAGGRRERVLERLLALFSEGFSCQRSGFGGFRRGYESITGVKYMSPTVHMLRF